MINNVISYDEKVAYSEVYDIIMFMNKAERKKIPTKFIEFLKANKQENYITKINPYLPLEFQKLSKKTQDIIAYVYRRYLANEEEKANFRVQEQKEFEEERKLVEESYNLMFNRNKTIDNSDILPTNESQNLPTVVEKTNIFKKIFGFIKKVLHI